MEDVPVPLERDVHDYAVPRKAASAAVALRDVSAGVVGDVNRRVLDRLSPYVVEPP